MPGDAPAPLAPPLWRQDVDALAFQVPGHGGVCLVHRLAFRTLLGYSASAGDCWAYFTAHSAAFEAAARAKVRLRRLDPAANLHLTSRDVRRAGAGQPGAS